MRFHNVLLACALGAGSLAAVAPASAATVRVYPGHPYRATVYRVYRSGYAYPYRWGYGYPYGVGYGYPYGVGVGVGYGYPYGGGYGYVGGYGYAPYPAVYARPAYWPYRRYWRPYRRVYWGRRVIP